MNRTLYACVTSVGLGCAVSPGVAAEVRLEIVAQSGQPAPGIDGSAFIGFGESVYRKFINDAGQIAFAANVSPAQSESDAGIWMGNGQSLALVVREGQPVPALGPNITLAATPRVLGIANDGAVLFRSTLAGPSVIPSNNEALLVAHDGVISVVARRGLQAPGRPVGIVYTQFLDAVMGPAGHIAFTAGTNSGNAIWSFGNNQATLVAAVGDPAPGFPQGVAYMRLILGRMIGSDGDFGYHATVIGPASSYAMYRYTNQEVQPVLFVGDAAPGLPDGVVVAHIPPTAPAVATSGDIVFTTSLSGPDVTLANDAALWAEGGSIVSLVAREGDPAPGGASGSVFFGSDFARQQAAGGEFALFTSQTTGMPDSNGLWLREPAGLSLITRGGSQVPGAATDIAFASFTNVSDANYPPHIAMNADGRLAFTAMISGPGVTQWNNMGVWATDPERRIRKLVRTGDSVEVAPGITRIISTVHDAEVNAVGQFATAVNFAQDAALLIGTIGCAAAGCAGVDLAGSDCVINLNDLTALLAEFGTAGPNLPADIDRDGGVDLDDLAALLMAFGTDCR